MKIKFVFEDEDSEFVRVKPEVAILTTEGRESIALDLNRERPIIIDVHGRIYLRKSLYIRHNPTGQGTTDHPFPGWLHLGQIDVETL